MSIAIMSSVWTNSKQSGGKLLVLLAMADFADDRGICWPSVPCLAGKSRLSERQVQRVLRDLEDAQEIVTIKAGGIIDGVKKATVYKVTPRPALRQSVTPGQNVTGDTGVAEGVTPMSPSTVNGNHQVSLPGAHASADEPKRKPVTYRGRKVPKDRVALAERLIEHFASETKRSMRSFTKAGDATPEMKQVVGALSVRDDVAEDRWMKAVTNTVRNPPDWIEGQIKLGHVFGMRAMEWALENSGGADAPRTDANGKPKEYGWSAERMAEAGFGPAA